MKALNMYKQLDTNLANEWIVVHNKNHISDTSDLNDLIKRYNNHQTMRWLVSILIAGITTTLFGYWLSKMPEQINIESISGLSVLVVTMGIITYVLLWPQHPDKVEVFKSVRKFSHDWKELKKLERKGYGFDLNLYQIGGEISEAQRMLNKPKAERLKKKLRKEQKVLLAFGRCKEDWGIYIPEPRMMRGWSTTSN